MPLEAVKLFEQTRGKVIRVEMVYPLGCMNVVSMLVYKVMIINRVSNNNLINSNAASAILFLNSKIFIFGVVFELH